MQTFDSKYQNPKRPERAGTLVTVGRVEDVPPGRGATVELMDGKELALYNVGGQFYAIENFCPHRGAPSPMATSVARQSNATGMAGASTCRQAIASTARAKTSKPTKSISRTAGSKYLFDPKQ
jgi:nitrite reductase/ring-hydroxylating ferredoxin subunit